MSNLEEWEPRPVIYTRYRIIDFQSDITEHLNPIDSFGFHSQTVTLAVGAFMLYIGIPLKKGDDYGTNMASLSATVVRHLRALQQNVNDDQRSPNAGFPASQ